VQEKNSLSGELSIEEVSMEFDRWRDTKKAGERIPESLWETAVGLTSHYSISQVSQRLRLNYMDLKRRVHSSSKQEFSCAEFIELNPAQVFPTGECIIEMHRGDGSTMKMSFRGGMGCDPVELAKAFWGEHS
jgi:hypothetical protein